MDRKVLSIVFFTVFMDLVGFGIIIPIQTAYALPLERPPQLSRCSVLLFRPCSFLCPLGGLVR